MAKLGWCVYYGYSRSKTPKHPVSTSECLPTKTPDAFTPDWLLSVYSSHPLVHPSASLCLLMMFFLHCHIRGFHLQFWRYCLTLRQLKVWDPIWSISYKTLSVRPGRLLCLQQTFSNCLNNVPMMWNMGLRDRKSVSCYSPCGWLTKCKGKVVILFGKELKGEKLMDIYHGCKGQRETLRIHYDGTSFSAQQRKNSQGMKKCLYPSSF